jgi:hypothetical protein
MSQTHDRIEKNEDQSDQAFEIIEINLATGGTTILIQKGIIGALSHQLKNTSNHRKGSSILRKLGYVLSNCGDIQYGGEIKETDLDPDLVTSEVNEEDE